ncbi:hybrid sensor histidine kinase/response regulator transcription factor [Catalinimonas niigatensis]|uniref:hybrid sensor histidine kinase/response regulator transcription factor n=1 Tax=Catalinimonas niigatensis TaxID=1397264 RepID=UPI002665F7EC|nr:two-component regulator propeller domain-containing protein [Catalinimonas niigatensis]WPP50706.1 two-component regulator propeller domain-containing protein [Catalinimonas niigatensis]
MLSPASGQEQEVRFSHLDINQGLSNNQVNAIWKDQQGFMWFGTLSGLNRYDGYNFKVYKFDHQDSTSIADSYIEKIFEDHQGNLWVRTRRGLNVYDQVQDAFQRDIAAYLAEFDIVANDIVGIVEDKEGNFWYASPSQGLYEYHPGKATTRHFPPDSLDKEKPYPSPITAIEVDSKGDVWVVHDNGILEKVDQKSGKVIFRTSQLADQNNYSLMNYQMLIDSDGDMWFHVFEQALGLFYYQQETDRLHHFHKHSSQAALNTNIVHSVVQADNGLIWIGTDHGGINLLDKKKLSVRYLLQNDEQKNSLSLNSINTLYKEDNGTIWVGTFKRGIDFHHDKLFKFKLYKNDPSDAESLPYEDINTFVEDSLGNLWIGTNGGGLIYYNRKQERYTRYLHDPDDPKSISNNVIIHLTLDSEHKLWIGTYHGGLNYFDGQYFKRYRHHPEVESSLADDRIWDIFEDSQGNMWIGTNGGGLDLMNRKKESFIHFRSGDINSVSSDYISSIAEDSLGNLWIGSAYGVNVYSKKSGRFIVYLPEDGNTHSLSNINVNFVYVDHQENVWIGTREGLNLYIREKNQFRVFRKEDGLPDNTMLAMRQDAQNGYWISTPNGLSNLKFSGHGVETAKAEFKNYSEPEGLQGIEFNVKAACKTRQGELIFGGPNGFNIFFPNEMEMNEAIPEVVLTDLKIFNKSVEVGQRLNDRVFLKKSLNQLEEIVLKPGEDMISFEFAALNFFHPENNAYAYQLQGFNDHWITTNSQSRIATYTNLSPGQYTFKVKASNNDGFWSPEVKELNITVLPPVWKTKTAFVLYALILIAALLLARKIMLERVRMRFMMEQQQLEARQLHEVDMMKIKFFTNISHEFRTPLSLIISPIEKLMKQTADQDQYRHFSLIHRNAKRLLALVNQLLDFRKIEEQGIKLNPAEGDIIAFIREIVYSFSDLSENKNIALDFHSAIGEIMTHFDKDKLEKILFNLLSNAFKFTPEHGTVQVKVDWEKTERTDQGFPWLKIEVADTGIGIPQEKHEDIFRKFFQNEIPGTFINQGSGIGLSITQEFVKVHGGKIRVDSEVGKGACFTVLLPVEPLTHEKSGLLSLYSEDEVEGGASLSPSEALAEGDHVTQKPLLLLVEDHEDFRFYLKDNFKHDYQILEARNGLEGWAMTRKHIPDLIVSDVMMPEMNGIDFCEKVKNDRRSSHIPVILLTAKSAEDQKVEGFAVGADDYVAKPFNFEILESRIKNLIAQRESLKASFLKRAEVEPEKISISSMDDKLMKAAIKAVEEHIADPEFSVEDLSRQLGMSRVHLYKKLLALTGKSPIEFIRIIRLKRASQLLKESQLTVAEVAYEVGFNNPKYFSKYFKMEFNILPSLYASQGTK